LPLSRPTDILTIGLDRSLKLLHMARNAGDIQLTREVFLGDALQICWRENIFDYAISIATIHHLATVERRRMAVEVCCRCLVQQAFDSLLASVS